MKKPDATFATPSLRDGVDSTDRDLRLSPRQSRVVDALRPGHWVKREAIDRTAGSSNGPDIIYRLRQKLGDDAIEMQLIDGIDRDGLLCRTGRYRLTAVGLERLRCQAANDDSNQPA